MIQAALPPYMTGVDCGPAYDYYTPDNRYLLGCSGTVLFSSMQTIVSDLPGASLVTSP
jgi:hypothetical protein